MFTIAIIVALFLNIEFATAIRCYECSSHNNTMCEDPTLYDEETLNNFLTVTDCRHGLLEAAPQESQEFFCRKIKQTILHKHHDPDIRITRTCGWKKHRKPCYTADNDDHLETVCQCFEDKCNSGSNLHGTLAVTMLALVAIWRGKV